MAGIIPFYQAFKTALTPSGITVNLGAQFLSVASQPPRVVIVPTNEPFEPFQGSGGADQIGNPRPLWIRSVNLDFHLWAAKVNTTTQGEVYEGANIEACENLIDLVVRALHSTVGARGYLPETGQWMNVDGDILKYGAGYILPVKLLIPVTRAQDAAGMMATMPATLQAVNPDGSTETVLTINQ